MGAGGLLFVTSVVATGWWLVNTKPSYREEPRPSCARPMTGRELAGLVDVAYAEDVVLVTPRGVELPYSPGWDFGALMDTLAEVDAL